MSRLRRAPRQAATIARAVAAARRRPLPEVRAVDGAALRDLLAGAGADARLVDVPVNRPPWTPAGLEVAAGDRVTWLAWGRAVLIRPLGVAAGPATALAARSGRGPIEQSPRDTFTFVATGDGALELASMPPGEVKDDGTVRTDRVPYRAIGGGIRAVVARWPAGADPRAALEALAPRDSSGLCGAEAARLADPPLGAPPGWEHHPKLWPTEIYSPAGEGIGVHAREDVGIVRRGIDVPLTASLRARWSWRLDTLPSALPEDTLVTHDYVSVALESDDGLDLTWHWSSALPEGFAYRCPLEHWRRREFHVVARSGVADLGRWVDEERDVLADHRVAIGVPPPARVVGAWLITVAVFQRGEARGEVGRFELVDGDRVVRVV